MFCRFRTPLKEAPVWNVLITSICKESESETALLHSQREGRKRKAESGMEGGWKARDISSDPEQPVRMGLERALIARQTSFKEQFAMDFQTPSYDSLFFPL